MHKIHFTTDALARTRLGPPAGRIIETAFAVNLFGRGAGGALFSDWRRDVRRRLRNRSHVTEQLAYSLCAEGSRRRPMPELADQPVRAFGPESEEFHQVAVSPYWKGILDYLELDRDSRARIMLSGGAEALFASMPPQMQWNAPTLTISTTRSEETHLDERGLLLVPSLFLYDRVVFLPDPEPDAISGQRNESRSPVLIYPARLSRSAAEMLWQTNAPTDRALGALIGRTRAGVLQALTESCTTSELGKMLEISPAAASQHASTLRNAGLITTRRQLNTVLHTITPLGTALIRGHALGGAGASGGGELEFTPRRAVAAVS